MARETSQTLLNSGSAGHKSIANNSIGKQKSEIIYN